MLSNIAKEFTFSEMLCARFCHDMAGPIGALNNGVEFLSEDMGPDMQKQAVDLLKLSAGEAFIKLRTFRVAYGVVAHAGESSLEDTKEMLTEYFQYGNIELDWCDIKANPTIAVSNYIRQILVNMVLITSGFMIYGGTLALHLEKDKDGSKHIRVTGEGGKLKSDPEIEAILEGKASDDDIDTRNVHVFFTLALAKAMGITMNFRKSDKGVELVADYKKKL